MKDYEVQAFLNSLLKIEDFITVYIMQAVNEHVVNYWILLIINCLLNFIFILLMTHFKNHNFFKRYMDEYAHLTNLFHTLALMSYFEEVFLYHSRYFLKY